MSTALLPPASQRASHMASQTASQMAPRSQSSAPASDPASRACFHIVARHDPGTLPRLLEVFAKRGLVPSLWRSVVGGRGDAELHVDVQVPGLAGSTVSLVAETLRSCVLVELVLTSAIE